MNSEVEHHRMKKARSWSSVQEEEEEEEVYSWIVSYLIFST